MSNTQATIQYGKVISDFTPKAMPFRDVNAPVIDINFNGLNQVVRSHSDRISSLSLSINSVNSVIGSLTIPLSANPSVSVGLSAVNGSALTFMRSDAAPAISQAIIPTWTGNHTFSSGVYPTYLTGGSITFVNKGSYKPIPFVSSDWTYSSVTFSSSAITANSSSAPHYVYRTVNSVNTAGNRAYFRYQFTHDTTIVGYEPQVGLSSGLPWTSGVFGCFPQCVQDKIFIIANDSQVYSGSYVLSNGTTYIVSFTVDILSATTAALYYVLYASDGTTVLDSGSYSGSVGTIASSLVYGFYQQASNTANCSLLDFQGFGTSFSLSSDKLLTQGYLYYDQIFGRVGIGQGSSSPSYTLDVKGTFGLSGVATFVSQPIVSSLTASQAVFTDGSNGLVSNALTGTGSVVMSASPTLTGTLTAATANFSGTVTMGTYTGQSSIVTLGTIATGTWNATAIADGKIASSLTGKTYNGLSLTALATGFTVSGGTTSKTLTVPLDASVSGTNTGDQTITLTGDVTGSGTGSFATTIANNAVTTVKILNSNVTLAKIASIADQTILGNNTGGSAAPVALTAAQTKTVLSLNNVENTALSTWAGTANITTVGTLTSGTWSATAIAETKGGTNQTSYTLGDILYASASNTLSKLAGSITTTIKILSQTGTGSVSAAPAWNATTGTGNVVMSASPTFTGTISAAIANFTGQVTVGADADSSGTGLTVNGASAATRNLLIGQSAGVNRAIIRLDASNNLVVSARNNSTGAAIDIPFSIALDSGGAFSTPRNFLVGSGTNNPQGETSDITIGAGSSGDVVAALTTRGFRTTNNAFTIWYAYHGANNVGKVTFSRDAADDAGTFNVFTQATGGALTNRFSIKSDGTATFQNATTILSTLAVSGISTFSSDIKLGTAGNGIYIKEGTNATMGVATLVLGTKTVSTTKVTANSRIFLCPESLGTITSPVALAVTARSAGTSFTITSANLTDTSSVAWVILEPA